MQPQHLANLEKAFKFTQDDLQQNRYGKLTPSQAAKLRADSMQLFYLIGGAILVIGILTMLTMRSNAASEMFLMLACLAIPAGVGFAFTLGTTSTAISAQAVSRLTGQVHISNVPYGFNPPLPDASRQQLEGPRWSRMGMYTLVIENRWFHLTLEEHQAIIPGVYTVYFVPSLHKIVALEKASPLHTASEVTAQPTSASAEDDLFAVPPSLPTGSPAPSAANTPPRSPDDGEEPRA